MRYILKVAAEAEEDIRQAYIWYEEQNPGLGDRFIKELERCFTAICDHPQYYGFHSDEVRKCITRTFPYIILFVPEYKHIRVISVFHTRREPLAQ